MRCTHDTALYTIPDTIFTITEPAPDCTPIVTTPKNMAHAYEGSGNVNPYNNENWTDEVNYQPSCTSTCEFYFDTCGTGSQTSIPELTLATNLLTVNTD